MKKIHQKEIEILKSGNEKQEFNQRIQELQKQDNFKLIDKDMVDNIKKILTDMEAKNLFKGKGGEIMRFSVNHFIQCCAISKIEFSDEYLNKFQEMLIENSMHSNVDIQLSATTAFKHLCNTYHNDETEVNENKEYVIKGVSKLIERSVKDSNIDVTRGCNMIFGNLSKAVILCMQQTLLKTVLSNMVPKDKPNDDAETRKYAVKSQIRMLNTLNLNCVDISIIRDTIEHLYQAIQDYAVDKRGDVGSWVREEAMRSLSHLIYDIYHD